MAIQTVGLSGWWEFRLDPADEGVEQGWHDEGVPFGHRIAVPGAWNAQGFGFPDPSDLRAYEQRRKTELAPLRSLRVLGDEAEAERVFHVFPGPAWYRTTATVPATWHGASLVFTAIHRYATVWIDGRLAATHRSYLTPLTIDLAPFAAPGAEIAIVVRVDARHDSEVDPLLGCLDTLDFVHTEWGGIHHHVRLEESVPDWFDDVAVVSRLDERRVEVTARAHGAASYAEVRARVEDATGQVAGSTSGSADSDGRLRLVVPMSEVTPWTPDQPYLYRLRLECDTATYEVRFGMRELTVEGDQFLLNGRPFFVRGYGDDCVFPDTIAPPADIEVYRRRLAIAREYGFTYVRLHSWVPPEEYLDAADEVGMFVQPELPLSGPGPLPDPATHQSIVAEWERLIRRFRNHPSVAAWCMGNELYDSLPIARELYDLAKALDPTRLVIESDGSRLDALDRPTLDFASVPFDEGRSLGFGDGKYDLAERPVKPVVAHEAGYFQTLPDPAERDRFAHGLNPYWLRGITADDDYARRLEVSKQLQAACLKANVEAARRSGLAGISVWLLQDYPNCAEGVLDLWLRPKALTAAEFRRFNGPTVLLLDLARRNLRGGERVRAELVVSCFADAPPPAATLRWNVRCGDQSVASGTVRMPVRLGVHLAGVAEFDVPDVHAAARLTFSATLDGAGLRTDNAWDLWVYPPAPRLDPTTMVVDRITSAARDRLDAGGSVLLLDPGPDFDTESITFRPTSWDGAGHYGLVFDPDHPALRAMPTDGWCDLQFHRMVTDSTAVAIDGVDAEPIVTCSRAPGEKGVRSVLFEQRVGAGRLLVCGLDLRGAIDDGDPAAAFLLSRLVDYLRQD